MTAVSMLVGAGLGTALAAYMLYRNHRAELDRRRLVRQLHHLGHDATKGGGRRD